MTRPSASRFALLAAVLVLVPAGCRKPEPAAEEGKELSKNPIAAMGQISDAAEKAQKAMKEAGEMKAVPPVPFAKLIELLPPAPNGWTPDGEPRGETTTAAGFSVSKAERSFSNGDKHLHVSITDGAYNAPLYAAITMVAQFSHESTEGFEKGVTIDGEPGVEKFRKDGGHGEITVVVGKRYLVTVEADGVAPDFARTVFGQVDRARLASLK